MRETTAIPAPGTTTDLRDRLQRARARLVEKRDDPGQDWHERARMVGKVEGVDLALAEVAEERGWSTLTLRQRLTDILDDLQAKYRTTPASKRVRIGGKVEGVKLALSYVHDGERMAPPAQPALVVTPAFVQRFENEYRWMIREQIRPLGQRDPLAVVRVYAVATVLADLLRASGVQGVPDGEPGSVLVALRDLLGMHDGQSFADDEG